MRLDRVVQKQREIIEGSRKELSLLRLRPTSSHQPLFSVWTEAAFGGGVGRI